jgi:cellulose synthase/poly-beta-1,6-N-acetylglucosamine synthase-like glycosyltransferase
VRIRIIDAFTDRPFTGNPAAVCLLDADTWPEETWMRQVAAEMNLSTAGDAYSRRHSHADVAPARVQDHGEAFGRLVVRLAHQQPPQHSTQARGSPRSS